MQYFVDANNLEELLEAKEIMESSLSSIYNVLINGNEDYLDSFSPKEVPAYINAFEIYNLKLRAITSKLNYEKAKKQKKARPQVLDDPIAKRLPKGRFQIFEMFSNEKFPKEIPLYTDF